MPADHDKSQLELFYNVVAGGEMAHYFYLQLKDLHGNFTHGNSEEISVLTKSGLELPFQIESSVPGHYYISLLAASKLNQEEVVILAGGKKIGKSYKLSFQRPTEKNSKITFLYKKYNQIVLRLSLFDEFNRPVSLASPPEILLEGFGDITDLRHIQEGIWEFTLSYGEFNQILYLSLRTQGAYFSRFYRYQHVEK